MPACAAGTYESPACMFAAKTSGVYGVTRFSVSRFSTSVTENRVKLNDFLAEEDGFLLEVEGGTSLQLGVYALRSYS